MRKIGLLLFGLAALLQFAAARAADLGEGEVDAGTDTTPLQNWQLLLGILLPLLIAWLLKSHWTRRTQSLIMIAVVLVTSAITMWLQGSLNDIDSTTFVAKALELLVVTQAAYYGIWKPLGVSGAVQENVPSPLPG